MGQYLFLTDHSGIGNPHAKPTTSNYTVERLDQLKGGSNDEDNGDDNVTNMKTQNPLTNTGGAEG